MGRDGNDESASRIPGGRTRLAPATGQVRCLNEQQRLSQPGERRPSGRRFASGMLEAGLPEGRVDRQRVGPVRASASRPSPTMPPRVIFRENSPSRGAPSSPPTRWPRRTTATTTSSRDPTTTAPLGDPRFTRGRAGAQSSASPSFCAELLPVGTDEFLASHTPAGCRGTPL